MTTTAKVIADSVSREGKRITTLELRYPRIIHPEFMTHRQFSRNASSSRAIPLAKLIQDVLDDPFVPSKFGMNKPGMQAEGFLEGETHDAAVRNWLDARDVAVLQAKLLGNLGVHKQLVNRLLEPFCHINVVCTSTEWDNFFGLRLHPDAQPEIYELADAMYNALDASEPAQLADDEWHLPYITDEDWQALAMHGNEAVELALKVSVARCARVSYRLHDGQPTTLDKDLKLYDMLVGAQPIHASPAEHQARPDPYWQYRELWGNYHGWVQYRKTLNDECITHFSKDQISAALVAAHG